MDFEFAILDFISNYLSSPPMDVIMKFFTFLGNAGWFWIVSGITLSIIPKTRKMGLAVCFALLLSVAIFPLKSLFARDRPFEIRECVNLLISAPHDHSFPSGHSSVSFAAATTIFLFNKKWGSAALVVAALIAFSRLYLYVHFPSDVFVGICFGISCSFMGYYLSKKLHGRISSKTLDKT